MFSAVILAGGKGERFGSTIPKPFMSLNGKPILQYSIDTIGPLVDELIIVCGKQYRGYKCVTPGKSRSESVENGLTCVSNEYVIIHDGTRPFVRTNTVNAVKALLLNDFDCVDAVSPILDGFVDGNKSVSKEGKMLGLTPEGFKTSLLRQAFKDTHDRTWQDEVTMVQTLYGTRCGFVNGRTFNSKITYSRDLSIAEGIMKFWDESITTKPRLGRPILILGGSGGIGKACASRLEKSYCPTRKEIDLGKDYSIDLSKYKAIIHSAGEYFDESKIMKVNFDSCVRLIHLAEKQDWKGNIVFLSSTAATYGRKGIAIYSASKSALNAYIESRHEELAEKGIYINAIAPAKVDTKLQSVINPDTPKNEMMTPEYVADYVLRYTDTKVHGHIIFLRKGFDN